MRFLLDEACLAHGEREGGTPSQAQRESPLGAVRPVGTDSAKPVREDKSEKARN